ncbi:unnamed protein product [Fraxinus pennsylvanica]|uniref:TPX2 central domain-containing protein n=1 Tax=Fraxinus pennsylvanica TaxID=56036 RepID=A0AAD1ZLA3_9LAMI|nr:unnamed protein product [Fraxinus pennsylvanica]
MDEVMKEFIEECFEEPLEIDETYEFDASSFFDFTRPESDSEIEVAERWFEISGDYPPSPFFVKLNLGKVFSVDVVHNSSNSKDSKKVNPMSNSSDVENQHVASSSKKNTKGASSHILQNSAKTKTNSATKLCQSRSSTLMRPTASHLAKQNKLEDTRSSCVCTRFQKNTIKVEEKIAQSPPRFNNPATKRQKLEIGYLRKVTVPKEPELETLLRAQKRRSKNSSESSEHEKPKASAFRARQSNRKILQAPLLNLHQPKKKTEFQEFHLKTTEKATQHVSANVLSSHTAASHLRSGGSDSKSQWTNIGIPIWLTVFRPNSRDTLKPEKRGTSLNSKSQKVFPSMPDDAFIQDVKQEVRTLTVNSKEFKIHSDNSLSQIPPMELFTKLSLRSDIETNEVSQPKKQVSNKGSKENVPGSLQPEFWLKSYEYSQSFLCRAPEAVEYSGNVKLLQFSAGKALRSHGYGQG